MADLKISELAALAGGDLAAGDLLAAVDVSASETKKITVQDVIGYGVTLIADATIPGAKILFNSGTIAGSALAAGGVSTTQLADDGVTAAKLADESTVDLVTTLPASGAYVGQLALDTDDLKVYCWNGSAWQSIKAAGSINTVTGDTSGTVNITVSTSGDSVTIAATLDNTDAANQFLAGPTNAGGSVSYRTIEATDLPTATTGAKGAVQVNGEGLRMDGAVLEVDNDVAASTADYKLVTYTAKGLVTGGRAIEGSDLPIATGGSVGAVQPGTGLSVTGGGVLNHSNSVTSATATKITYDAQGHVTSGTTLSAGDIPSLPASKITSGTLDVALIGNNVITGGKLANASTVKFGGSGSTEGVVTFPSPEFQGQYFFDALNGDLYLYDGSAWQPITITAGELIYGGTYDASQNEVKSVTQAGTAAGLVVGSPLPNAANSNLRYYLVVSDSGTGTAPAPAVALAPPDMIVSGGTSWELIDVSNGIAGQLASNISFTPYAGIAATNVQTALQELEDEKLAKAGGTVTGNLEIGAAGSLTWEGSTADSYETTLTVVDPTADRTITLPDVTGTVITTGDTGTVTSTMIANGTIVDADINASAAISGSKIQAASTSNAGAVQLTDSTSSTSTTTAATPASVKTAYDLANAALPKTGGTISGNVDNSATGYFDLPAGTTAQRPGSPNTGMIRYNTDLSQFEGYSGSAWGTIGGGAKGGGTDQVFYENGQSVTSNYTVGATTNAMTAGPITINSGVTVTVSSGGNWVIV